ncbi:MAG: carboxypeptidase regulatory-like domain-containing protein [Candidatus Cloacimonetes bacterium]|nr:carboxypeptidase regulatory-like domain-containing protein [Candidatus Cloacimonadota bacterium]
MKKYFVLLIAIMIAFSLMAKNPNGSYDRRDKAENPSNGNGNANINRDPWDNLLQFDVDTPSGQTGLAGMEWDGEFFYATKWSGSNLIFKFDSEGNYIESITAPLTGARDLAFDGEYMYGSAAASTVYCWESATGVAVPANNIEVTGQAVRAIAYDPLTDTFWSGNFGDDVAHWDRDGNVLETFTNPGVDFYGLAFDPNDPEGPFLYGFHQSPGCSIVKIDPETFDILETVDVTAQGGTGAIAGGLCYMNDWDPALRTLGALLQGTPDYICVYELGENAPAGAPAAPDMFTVTPNAGGALSADLGWMNPTETVAGDALTDLDEMRVYRNDELIHTITNPTIGGIVNWTDTPAAAGSYNYSVVGFNDEGEGIAASASAYIGEDVPAAVTSITVANVGGDAVIGWANPTAGLHNGPFNQPIQGYHIERSDGEEFEPTGIMTTWTDNTIPEEGLYAYTITPYNSIGDGGSASSEMTWIGDSQAAMFGDPNTATTHNYTPINFYWKNSLSQTIYYADEFAAQGFGGGAITAIMYYNNFAEDLTDMPINIWMQNTTLDNLSGGWESATDMTQVFSGTLNFPNGINEIMIDLDEPFIYEGGNLIVFVERVMDTVYWNYSDVFYYTDTQYTDRSIYIYSDTVDYDPYNPPATMSTLSSNPNTMMFINTTGLGSMAGYAYDTSTGDGLAGVDINVIESGLRLHTVTDANGHYSFPGLFEGDYEATATKFAYSEDIQTFTVVADETTNLDFNLTPVDNVTVSGRVVGSDYPNIGLANATVTLSGMGVHEGITDANGEFSIDGVYSSNTYELVVIVEGYDIFIGEAVIGVGNTDLGDITVNEIAIAPYDMFATVNVDDTEAELIWHSPAGGAANFWDFEADDGEFTANTGWAWGTDSMAGAYSGDNVWGTILNGEYPNSASFELVTPEINIPTDDAVLTFWHWVDIESSWDGGNIKISTDGGSSWTLITPVGGYPGTAVGLAGEACFNGYTQTWSMVTFEIGAYQGEEVMFKFHFGSDSSITYQGWYIDDVYVGMPENRELDNPYIRHIADITPQNLDTTRIIESYAIYRLPFGEENNPAVWEDITTGVSDTTYVDPSWNNVDTGLYRYAVRAEYTNNVLSDPAISNWLAKNNSAALTVNITTNVGDIAEGALVSLDATEPDPEGNYPHYEGIADDAGVCVIPGIWMSNYDIEVELFNFMTGEDNIDIYSDTTYDIMLTELAFAPYDAYVEENHSGNAFMTWHSPSGALESSWDFEDDNGEFVGEAGWEWANGTNAGAANSGENCWSTWPGADYPNSANSSLYTPVIEVPSDEAQLTFYHWYDIENYFDGGNVKISLDEGATWEIITPVGGYPEDAATTSNSGIPGEPCYSNDSGGWVLAVFDLSIYDGEDVMFRFHFGSDSSVVYPGWDIDDVRIGEPDERSISLSLASKIGQQTSRDERMMEGYAIFRGFADDEDDFENWDLVVDSVQDTTYEDETWQEIEEPGTYEYCIRAMYTNGVLSAPAFTNEIGFDMYAPVTINVTADSGDPTDGATVVLTSNDGEHIYEATVSGGMVTWAEIWKTAYSLAIELEGYEDYTQTDIYVTDALTLNIELLELVGPPANLAVDELTGMLTWTEPGTGGASIDNILFVDDDGSVYLDFSDTQSYYTTILDASGIDYEVYEIMAEGDDGPDAAYMADFALVVWECGEQWQASNTLSTTDETELATYIDAGGFLVLSAHDYLWDRYPSAGNFSAGQLPYDYLGLASANQDAFTVGTSQGGPEFVDIDGAGCTAGLSVQLQDVFSAMRDGVYLDYLTPNANGAAYSTHDGNNVGVQTTNTIFTTAGWAGLVDGDNTVLEYALASFANFSNRTRHLDYYNVYIDNSLVGQTTELEFNLAGLTIFEANLTYDAGVSAHFSSGNESEITTLEFTCHWVGSDADQDVIFGVNALGDNYPNPFNPVTNFAYSVKDEALVSIEIYNVKGQKVRTLVNEVQTTGIYRVTWTGDADNGSKVSSGIYFYKLNTGDFTRTKKMILMK